MIREIPEEPFEYSYFADLRSNRLRRSNFPFATWSKLLRETLALYDRITSPTLLVRRITVTMGRLINEDSAARQKETTVEFDLFNDLEGTAQKEEAARLAEEKGIPWQTKTKISGGTDASAIQRSGAGARVAAISAAVRNIHSPSCVFCLADMQRIYDLALAFLEAL